MSIKSNQKSLFISLIGETNAGKSSLANAILDEPVSIVTHKHNTTKDIIPIICTQDEFQFVFYDTVGLMQSKDSKYFFCKKSIAHIKDSDLIVLVCDIKKIYNEQFLNKILYKIYDLNQEIILLVNKIDLSNINDLKEISDYMNSKYSQIKEIFYISAKKRQNLASFVEYLKNISLPKEWLYPAEQITNKSSRFIASELTRESLLLNLEEEIPHNLKVVTDSWKEKEKYIIIHQSIIIFKDSHKKIILGSKGTKIKKISLSSKAKIEHLLNKRIHLYLYVKFRENISKKIM